MEKLLNAKQLADKFSTKPGTIYSWVSRRLIPYVKVNGLTRFREAEIEEWHERQESERRRKNFE